MTLPLLQSLQKLRESRESRARLEWARCVENERVRRMARDQTQWQLEQQKAERAAYAEKIKHERGTMEAIDQLRRRAWLGKLDARVAIRAKAVEAAEKELMQAVQATKAARSLLNAATVSKEKTQHCIDDAKHAARRERISGEEAELDDETETFGMRRLSRLQG